MYGDPFTPGQVVMRDVNYSDVGYRGINWPTLEVFFKNLVMPGWGLTILLPQAIGVRRAREMSFTGNFLSAEEAFHFGLVNHVVAHDQLLPVMRQLALDIIGTDQAGVRQIRRTYGEVTADADGWAIEARDSAAWREAAFDPAEVAARRAAIRDRGRRQ